MEPGKIYQDPNLRLNDQEWLRGFDTLEHLNNMAGPSTIQTLIDTITKGVANKFSSLLPKKSNEKESKNYEDDSDEELANRMSKLSINAVVNKAVKKAMKIQHRCSKCNKIGHHSNSPKCPKNKKKSRSKKKGNINKVTLDSSSDTNNSSGSDSGSDSETESDVENTPSESESDHSINIHVSKRVILDMLDGITPIDWIEKLKAKIENPSSMLPSAQTLPSQFTEGG
ncbi:480_t:CDS:2 [Gigaspora rosea]|nr:480_t:CDS:2 [Gigaspora rosea]